MGLIANLSWLKSYGAVVAASIAAIAAVANGFWQAHQDRRTKESEWLREVRIPRYTDLLQAAATLLTAIAWRFVDPDEDTGPPPLTPPDLDVANDSFGHAFAAVALVGPSEVARAAMHIKYALSSYRSRLEVDPSDWGQEIQSRTINDFTRGASKALGIESSDTDSESYSAWLQAVVADEN